MLALRDNTWNTFDSIFDDFFRGYTYPTFRHFDKYPVFNAQKDGEDLKIEAAVPGFDKDEIDISITDGVLTIQSSKETNEETEGTRSFYKTSFVKRFVLPEHVGKNDEDTPEAKMENGVLSIVFKGAYKELPAPEPKSLSVPIT